MVKFKNLNLAQMEDLASLLGKELKNRQALIGLIGPLGAGKTTFVKFLSKYFGIKRTASPTFVLRHEHKIKQGIFYHLDFYRLKNSKQLTDLGLPEMRTGKNIILVEWIDRFPKLAKQADLLISFKVKKNNKRDVSIQIL